MTQVSVSTTGVQFGSIKLNIEISLEIPMGLDSGYF